jgi:predicted O-methyltransferase YrrM
MLQSVNLVPAEVALVMRRLEERDARDREDGTPRAERLRAIRPEVGEFLLILALSSGARSIVEIGTSGGYSTLWLALAARTNGGRVTTFEVDPSKVALAREIFLDGRVDDVVELRHEDALPALADFDAEADLVFLDAEKEDYERFLPAIVAALRPGGILVADNLLSHALELEGFRRAALEHPDLTGLVVPIGRGELVAVKAGRSRA